MGCSSLAHVSQLKVREHPVLGPYVENLTAYAASSFQDIQSALYLSPYL